jgi:ketosteroid isomerase-like protein
MNNTIIQQYFDAFTNKNLEVIQSLLADDVALLDWNVQVYGKADVIKVFANIFNSFNTIEVDIINSIIEGNQAAVQINIQLDDISLKVMDVISFTDTSITKIDAYKQ